MEQIKKKILGYLRINNGKSFQKFFENLHALSLHGMGYGEGAGFENSGEKYALKNIKKKLKKQKKIIIFDVGANIGGYSFFVNKNIKNAEIFAFEPSKKTFNKLQDNLKNFGEINKYNFGFGNKEEIKTLFYDEDFSGLASLYKRKIKYWGVELDKQEEVKINTIDNFCKNKKILRIDFLKMDIEGNELNALEGAKKMIKNKKIKFIQFEFGGCNIDSKTFFRDFWNLLHKNYIFYRIYPGGLFPIKKYKENLEIFTTSNYFLELKKNKKEVLK
ncbi:FkbM family methyltransferase [Candidatus Pacearchaeota archaeon]|nr:FkbM family methyltransferase [Candidatus Pacearchaeota archaeon]